MVYYKKAFSVSIRTTSKIFSNSCSRSGRTGSNLLSFCLAKEILYGNLKNYIKTTKNKKKKQNSFCLLIKFEKKCRPSY